VRRDRLERAFRDEAARHLEAALTLLEDGEDVEAERLTEIFRRLHSVKGMAASVGCDDVAAHSHGIEERVDQARRGPGRLDPGFRDELAGAVRALREEVSGQPSDPERSVAGDRLPPARLPAERLDRLFDLALGLSAAQQRLEHRLGLPDDGELLALRDGIGAAVRDLRREILELRLLPVRSLLPLLEGAVRRWSQERGVRVQVSLSGDGVRADRRMLERLLDPLGHLLRNAIVHGIEPPAEREAVGKPRTGTIRVTARRRHDRLVLRVCDDGRGVDPEEVVERACRRGLVAPGHARSLSPESALDLLTRDGMSRLEVADGLAGRGVGLSAARAEIERLGGTLRLRGRTGPGLTVEICVPLGLAVLDAFVVRTRGQTFAIPVAAVREVHRGEGTQGPRGAPPDRILDLGEGLGLPQEPGAAGNASCLLVVERPGTPAALAVDRIVSRAEVVIRPLGPPLESVAPWTGAALLPWGGLALLLDPLRVTPTARAIDPETASATMSE
jgi:two-component system chemotaxis sensor kinase CheA